MTALDQACELLKPCRVCPRECRADRTAGQVGFCGVTHRLRVASAAPHFGEEAPLVGTGGSGTIFLSGCNLACIFCQNYQISQEREGRAISTEEMVKIMLALQGRGCHNINFVSPTHFGPQIIAAIEGAREQGLQVPIVYNSGGYDSVEMLRLLDGYVDIYMPDAKYWDDSIAEELSSASNYPEVMREALKEMHRQVGDLVIENGIATRGLLVRHLVLPGGLAGSTQIIDFIAREISPNTYVNVMDQYRPAFKAQEFPEIARHPEAQEFASAYTYAQQRGLRLAD